MIQAIKEITNLNISDQKKIEIISLLLNEEKPIIKINNVKRLDNQEFTERLFKQISVLAKFIDTRQFVSPNTSAEKKANWINDNLLLIETKLAITFSNKPFTRHSMRRWLQKNKLAK